MCFLRYKKGNRNNFAKLAGTQILGRKNSARVTTAHGSHPHPVSRVVSICTSSGLTPAASCELDFPTHYWYVQQLLPGGEDAGRDFFVYRIAMPLRSRGSPSEIMPKERGF